MCVSPTFASPIEKPATSAHRRICREIIGNTEENAKTVDSLGRCKWPNSASKSAPETKKPTGGPVGGESKKWSGWWGSNPRLSAPKADALSHCATPRRITSPEVLKIFIRYIRFAQYSKKTAGEIPKFPLPQSFQRDFSGKRTTHTSFRHPHFSPLSAGTTVVHNSSDGMILIESSSERSMPILTPGSGPKKISRSFCS